MKKKILSLLLAVAMLCTMVACGNNEDSEKGSDVNSDTSSASGSAAASNTDESAYPDYLNLDAYYPLVKEGTDITLKMTVIDSSELFEYPTEERYFYQFIEQKMNINLEVTEVSQDGATEYLNMLFASDDLPDIIITSSALTADQLVTYGVEEGQLLDFAPYMNDVKLMPAFNEMCETETAVKASLTATDGGIYTQVLVADSDAVGSFQRRTVNTDMLAAAGVDELPTTLDEFIDAMYKVKAAFPDSTPIGGCYDNNSMTGILLNALGINDSANNGEAGIYSVGIRNGAVTVAAADQEVYGEFLSIMKDFYDDGIISRDYFTMDADTNKLNVENGQYAVWTGWLNPLDFDDLEKYEQLPALSSEYSEEAFVGHPSLYTIGRVVASAKTEYPELIARFCDYYYSKEGNHVNNFGPFICEAHEDLMIDGFGGCYFTDAGQLMYADAMPDSGDPEDYDYSHTKNGEYDPSYEYKLKLSQQGMGYKYGQIPYRQEVNGWTEIKTDYDNWKASEHTANSFWRCDAYDTYMPVKEYGIPILWFDSETSQRINELKTVLEPYMETETVKFITGERNLDELDAYFEQLDALGYQEYIGYYADAYASYLSNL